MRYATDATAGGRARAVAERPPLLALTPEQLRRLGLANDPRAAAAGARAKESGRGFEREIEDANQWYEARGIAVVYRHYPAIEGWGRTLRVVGRGPADFSGVHRGIPIAFDCKVITGSASYRHAQRDRHQLESLLRFRAAGGRAFLLLRCRELDLVWLLEDLRTLAAGDAITVRSKRGDSITHYLPVLGPSAPRDVARGTEPGWRYLSLLSA